MNTRPLSAIALLPALAVGLAQFALPAQAAEDRSCKTRSRSAQVAVVVCPAGAKQETLRAAGVAACKDTKGQCNAWIWDDASKAPTKAPEKDTDLPKSTTGSARAVWLNDSQSLMELRKAR